MTAYFVRADGNDALDGRSEATAWRTLAKVNATRFGAGDVIRFRGGDTFQGRLELGTSQGGTPLNPVIVESYGNGRATIRNTGGHGIFIHNASGITVRNLMVAGSGWASSTHNGIYLYTDLPNGRRQSGITIGPDVEVHGFQRGVSIGSWPPDAGGAGFDDVEIRDTRIRDCRTVGIFSWGPQTAGYPLCHRRIVCRRVLAHDLSGERQLSNEKIFGDGIMLSNVDGGLIDRCVTHTLGHRMRTGGGPIGQWAYRANNVVIQHGESYNIVTTPGHADGGGFALDEGCTNSIVQYCYSHDNSGAGFGLYHPSNSGRRDFRNNIIRYNISENDCRNEGYGAISIWGGRSGEITDTEIYHNTLFVSPASSPPSGLAAWIGTINTRIRNNIIVTTGGVRFYDLQATNHSGLLIQGNAYWASGATPAYRWGGSTYRSLEEFRAKTGFEQGTGFDVDPRLSSVGTGGTIGQADLLETLAAYRLLPQSPLIDAALDVPDRGERDFFGNRIPQGGGFDVGAGELAREEPGLQALRPDTILAASGVIGNIEAVRDDPHDPDDAWLSANPGFSIRFGFENPTRALAGEQVVEILFRAEAADRHVVVSLFENGRFLRDLGRVVPGSASVSAFTFSAAELAEPSGAGVEIRITDREGGE